jgi:hypothetical protein
LESVAQRLESALVPQKEPGPIVESAHAGEAGFRKARLPAVKESYGIRGRHGEDEFKILAIG